MAAKAALYAAILRPAAQNQQSLKLYQNATGVLPGGNTRTQLYTAPFPVFLKGGKGYQVTSEDGSIYTDLVGELTAGIYGHNHPIILWAIGNTSQNVGLNLGGTIAQEQVYAGVLCKRFGLDRVRFTKLGTEATINALAAARAFTGKRKIVVFGGGYHGGVVSFPDGRPAPNCVDMSDWIVAKYNDIESAKSAIQTGGVAAVLLEGMQGSAGAITAIGEFPLAIQEMAREVGALFMLDEVMTSRLSPGGLAALYGIEPDLKTFKKYLGGVLPFGAFGGRAEVTSVYDPRSSNSLEHHGTFNNNSMSLHVGYAGLTQILTPDACRELNTQGDQLQKRLTAVTKSTKLYFTGIGSLMTSNFSASGQRGVKCETDLDEDDDLKDLFWYEMLEQGFWTVKSGSIALILGTPQEELDRLVDYVSAFLARHGPLVQSNV